MSGYLVTLDIAKGALATAQNSLAVAGHNVSNVNTPGYSRQTARLETINPLVINGIQLGRGVTVEMVQRQADDLLGERLREQQSMLAGDEAALTYVTNLESQFNIQSDNELSAMISNFWNNWQSLSDNPSDTATREVLYQNATELTQRFNDMDSSLNQLQNHINQQIETGVGQVNGILSKIAELNKEIHLAEGSGQTANDQRDSRENLVTELSQLMSINTISQKNGFMTIMTDSGYPLVIDEEAYPLTADGDRIQWQTSAGGLIDISDDIKSGKISGWLDVSQEEIETMKTQLDSIARELIWQVNKVHSTGVGLKYNATEQSGSYQPVDSEGGLLSTLTYGNKIDYTKDFKMWTTDSNNPPNTSSVAVDMGISDSDPAYVSGTAGTTQGKYYFTVTTAGTVGSGSDNPVITWQVADYSTTPPGAPGGGGTVTVAASGAGNFVVDGMTFTIDPGYLVAGNTYTVNVDGAGTPSPVSITNVAGQNANSPSDNYVFKVLSGGGDVTGVSTATPMVIQWSNSRETQTITLDDPTNLTADVDGMTLNFNSGILYNNDVFTITTDENGFQKDSAGNFSLETSSQWHWTVDSFKDQFNTQSAAAGAHVTAYTNLDGSLKFVPDYGYGYAFSDSQSDDSGLTAALGINSFFDGNDARDISVSQTMENTDNIAAAKINGGEAKGIVSDATIADPSAANLTISAANSNNTFRFTENDVSHTVTLSNGTYASYTDLHSLAADIQTQMNAASTLGPPATYRVTYDETANQFTITGNDGSNLSNLQIFWSENSGTATALGFKPIDDVYNPSSGDYGISDNQNALEIAKIQNTTLSMPKWNFQRGQDAYSNMVSTTIEGSYQDMVSALGVKGSELKQSVSFETTMVDQLTQQRDEISGVSIDEEFVKMISYQQAYTAASKLIKSVDEMLQTLMSVK